MRSDAFDQQRELRMKGGWREGGGGDWWWWWEEEDLGMRVLGLRTAVIMIVEGGGNKR